MEKQQSIFIYIIAFLVLAIVLKAFGLINFESFELFSYTLIFYGVSLAFISFGTGRGRSIFLGTSIFLLGILIFVTTIFSFVETRLVLFPALFFIIGISFFMLFVEETGYKIPLYLSIIFILTGFVFTFLFGSFDLSSFISAVSDIFIQSLPLILIIGLLLFLLTIKR